MKHLKLIWIFLNILAKHTDIFLKLKLLWMMWTVQVAIIVLQDIALDN